MASWFDENASALAEAGISDADARDWAARNTNADGSQDTHRLIEAMTNDTGDRLYDSQDETKYDTHGNYIGGDDGRRDASGNRIYGDGGGNNNGGNSLGNWSNYRPYVAPFDYTPFTEQFVAPAAPADLMNPWTRTFTPTARPSDLGDKWDKSYVRPTATDLYTDPGYEARLRAGEDAAGRSAAARCTLQ